MSSEPKKGDARVDFGNYAKEFKGIREPSIVDVNGASVLRVEKDDEINLYNWNKVTGVTFKSTEGNKK